MTKVNQPADVENKLLERPGFLLRRCLQTTSGAFDKACADIGITPRQFDYLFVLNLMGESSQDQLGRMMGLDRATNLLVLRILKRKMFVSISVDSNDRRRRIVRLTDTGRETYRKAEPGAEASRQSVFECLTEKERVQFVEIMKKILVHAPRD